MNMNGDIQAARKLLSELLEAYQSLPRHLQLRVTSLLRESACPQDTESRTARPNTSRAVPLVSIL
jgi:hypothetical protein